MAESIVDMSNPTTKRRMLSRMSQLTGKYRFNVVRYRPRRSDRQNRYYWGVVVAMFQEFLKEQGEGFSTEDVHEILKSKFLREPFTDPRTGEFLGDRTRSTASLDTSEFVVYIDRCVAWLADFFDIVCPCPDSYRDTPAKAEAA